MNRIFFSKAVFSILFLALYGSSVAKPINNTVAKIAAINNIDKVIISGIIKDETGNPIENAKVVFDSAQVAVTDKTGAYSFELKEIAAASHTIFFSGEGFTMIVRTYYPIMGSTSFNIVLRKEFGKKAQSEIPHPIIVKDTVRSSSVVPKPTAPIIKPPVSVEKENLPVVIKKVPVPVIKKDTSVVIHKEVKPVPSTDRMLDLPSILFKPNLTALSAANKAFLDIVIEKLNNNPGAKVAIKANVPARNANRLIAQKRIDNIVRYLVEKNGIDAGRLSKETITGGGDVDIIDIVNAVQ